MTFSKKTINRQLASTILVIILLLNMGFGTYTNTEDRETNPPSIQTPSRSEPSDFSDFNFVVSNTEDALQGYNLFTIAKRNKITSATEQLLVITDMEGAVIAQHVTGMSVEAELVKPDIVILMHEYNVSLWNITSDELTKLNYYGHHDVEYNPNSDTIFLMSRYYTYIDAEEFAYDRIDEYSLNGTRVWTIDTQDFIPYTWRCPIGNYDKTAFDLTHGNSLFYDADHDTILYNPRNVDTFFLINHTSSEVIWSLGEHGDFAMYSQEGDPLNSLFAHGHGVEQVDDYTYIIFDNDFHDTYYPTPECSRIVEITINETTMTANHSFVWDSPEDYYSSIWGDADRLPNGNYLGTFGTYTHPSTSIGGRMVEIDPEGQIVWNMDFLNDGTYEYGIFACDRVLFHPYLSSPDDVFTVSGQNITLSWDTAYNFKPRQNINGTYTLYRNDVAVESGIVDFDRLWRKNTLTFPIDMIEGPVTNITLAITDDVGNTVSDSVLVYTLGIVIERDSPSSFEIGQKNSFVEWTVLSDYENITYEIYANSSLVESGDIIGSGLTFNLSTISVGHSHINLTVSNSSGFSVFDDFWITIYPAEAPKIITAPGDYSIELGSELILNWTVEDVFPKNWSIYIDGSLEASDDWTESPFEIQWTFIGLDEQIYNVTLCLYDIAGHLTTNTSLINVVFSNTPNVYWDASFTSVPWNRESVSLKWSTSLSTDFALWKNGSVFEIGTVQNNSVVIPIDWSSLEWRPGAYNLTIMVSNEEAKYTILQTWFTIYIDLGDPYADELIPSKSEWCINGDAAVGEPDDLTAILFQEYGYGYVTLDMGLNEEIMDGEGDDLKIWATGGNYSVWISVSLESQFENIGFGSGTSTFDLANSHISEARYVRVMCITSEDVFLDAVEYLHFEEMVVDFDSPDIIGPNDMVVYDNTSSINIVWNVYDLTPWNYTIKVDNLTIESGSWNGEDIEYSFSITALGNHSITLTLCDVFGNKASDIVIIQVLEVNTISDLTTLTIAGIIIVSSGAAIIAILWLKRRWKQ